jgi:flagellar hook-associated protein 1
MSLFSSIQMGGNTLQANEIALQVLGQNIANANTPGYIREEVQLSPAPTQRYGNLLLGTGVQVDAVVQKLDNFLEERLRGAVSDQSGAQVSQETYAQLEGLVGQLSDTGLNNSMNKFFNSISEILNQPESSTVRNLAMLQGDTLAKDFNNLSEQAAKLRDDADNRIQNMAADINRLIEQVRSLNIKIAQTESGNISNSDAVGLRDQRLTALESLAQLIDIRVVEQPSGGVAVYTGGDYLVYEGMSQKVEVVQDFQKGSTVSSIHIVGTDAALDPASGQLRGLLDSRDKVLGGFLDKLDSLAGTLAFEFNKIYSSGQGLSGYTSLTSDNHVVDQTKPLNDAGLPFTPANGSFQVLVHNKRTGLTQTNDIRVDLTGLGKDETLTSLTDQLNQIPGITAQITASGGLTLSTQSADDEFAFANDTSGALAALGLNTFFSGSSARDIGINSAVRADPSKFAASRGGIGADTQNAVDLAAFIDRPIAAASGASLSELYDRMAGETTQGSTIAKATADGAQVFENTLRGQKLSTSGVNIDEEAVKMISYQRTYQAAARYIATLSSLLELTVQL